MSLLLQLSGWRCRCSPGRWSTGCCRAGDVGLLLVVLLGGAMRCSALAELVRGHLLLHLRTLLDARMTLGFLDHLVRLPYAFFQRAAPATC